MRVMNDQCAVTNMNVCWHKCGTNNPNEFRLDVILKHSLLQISFGKLILVSNCQFFNLCLCHKLPHAQDQ